MPSSRRSPRRDIAAITIAILATASSSAAFNSYPTGTGHDQATDGGLARHAWPYSTAGVLREAVRQVDWDESSWDHWLTYLPNANYVAKHHFDRGPGVTSHDAFVNGRAYLKEQMDLAIAKGRAGNNAQATAALGRALHAIQDFYSHSNYIDLCRQDRAEIDRAMFILEVEPPAGLKLTGFDPAAADPERPTGDTYNHCDFSKDSPTKNNEARKRQGAFANKFLSAQADARFMSGEVIRRVRQAIQAKPGIATTATPFEAGLAAVRAASNTPPRIDFTSTDSLYTFLCEAPCSGAGCTLACGGTTLEVAPGSLPASDDVAILGVPENFFFSGDLSYTFDGSWTLLWREFRIANASQFSPPATAHVAFADSTLDGMDPSSVGVYFFDPEQHVWAGVAGASVDLVGNVAHFPVEWPGTYALAARMPGEVAVGACCTGDSTCTVGTAEECAVLGGVYLGAGSDCDDNPCLVLPLGGCCFGDSCIVLDAESCPEQCGNYLGDASLCDGALCGPVAIGPDVLSAVRITQEGFAVVLEYTLRAGVDVRGLHVLRRMLPAGEEETLAHLAGVAGDAATFRDSRFVAGQTYEYRLAIQYGDGSRGVAGPWRIETSGPVRPVLLSTSILRSETDPARIQYYVPYAGVVVLEVYSMDGRCIAKVQRSTAGPGLDELSWNGRDHRGARVASGVYPYVVRTGGAALSGKLLIVR